jgi:hypothetical protein
MIATSLIGFLALACTLQDVNPHTDMPIGKPHAASFVARDGKGVFIGWTEVDGQGAVQVAADGEGGFVLRGLKFSESNDETWANVHRKDDAYFMEWMVADTVAKDGRATVKVWSRGSCERLGEGKGTTGS